MTPGRPAAYYRERSRHFIAMVAGEVARGEMELACEVLWGAAAHAIKAVAQQKGWSHDSHALLRFAVIRMIEEGAPSHLRGQYYVASDFHVGFYEGSLQRGAFHPRTDARRRVHRNAGKPALNRRDRRRVVPI